MLGESFDAQLVDKRWGGRGEREKKKVWPHPKKRKMLVSPNAFQRKELRSPHREENDGPRDCPSPTQDYLYTTPSPPSSPSRYLMRSSSPSPLLVSSLRPHLVVGLKGRQMAPPPPPTSRVDRYSFSQSLDSHFGSGPETLNVNSRQKAPRKIKTSVVRKPKAPPKKKMDLITSSSDSNSSNEEDQGVNGHVRVERERRRKGELPMLAQSKDSQYRFLHETTDSPREKRTSCTSGDSDDSIVRVVRYRSENREVRCPKSPLVRPSRDSSTTSSSSSESNSDEESDVERTSRRAAIDFMLDCIDNDNDNDDDVGGSDIMDDGSRILLTSSDDLTSSDLTSDEYDSESDRQHIGESNYADGEEGFKGYDDTSSAADVYSGLPGRFRGWERAIGLDLSVGKYTREMLGLSVSRNLSDCDQFSSPVSSSSLIAPEKDGFGSSSDTDTDSEFDFTDLHVGSPAIDDCNPGEMREKKRLLRRKAPRKRDASRHPARRSFETPQINPAQSPVLSFGMNPHRLLSHRETKKSSARWGNSSGSETAQSSEWHVASSLSDVSEDDFRSDGSSIPQREPQPPTRQMDWKSAVKGVFFLQRLTALFVTHCVMDQKRDLTLLPSDFLKEWVQGIFLHLLALPILHPIFCIFLFTLLDLIPYHNFFQAIAMAQSMGLFQTLFPTMLLHVLRDISHITTTSILHQTTNHLIPKRRKRELGQRLGRGQNFRFLAKCGRMLMSLFGKFLSNYVALIISTFSTVAFIVVTTRQVFYNATADEPIGLLGTLGLLSQEPDGLFGVTMKSGSFLMGVMTLREIALFISPKSKLLIYTLFAFAFPFSLTILVRVSLGDLYTGTSCRSGSDCAEVLIREGLANMAPKYWAFCWLVIPSILAGVVL